MMYSVTTSSLDTLWNAIYSADKANFVMGVGTPSASGGDSSICSFNLPCGHAYTVLSAALVDYNGP